MSLQLSHSDLETIEEIKNADYLTITKGKDKSGISFLKHIFDLHQKIYGQTCSNCPSQLPNYINQIKNFNQNKMEDSENITKEFQLKRDVIVPVPGTSEAYSQHNITDEIAISLLAENENRLALFEKVPENLEDLISDYKAKQLEVNQDEDEGDDEFLEIDGNNISVEQALSLLEKLNIKTRASTIVGLKKALEKLTPEETKEFSELAASLVDNKNL